MVNDNPYAPPESTLLGADNRYELIAFVGPRFNYYLSRWQPVLDGRGRWAGFNWAAFSLSCFWIGYRKLYRILAFIQCIPLLYLVLALFYLDGVIEVATGVLTLLIVATLSGVFGNLWYLRQAQSTIRRARAEEPESVTRKLVLAEFGGTSMIGALLAPPFVMAGLFLAMGIVVLLGRGVIL